MLQMLAAPEEDEGRPDLLLVSARDGGVHALEQAPTTAEVAHVRLRDRRVADERVAEGDVPGADRVRLRVEALAAARQAAVASQHAREGR